jgi:hypothetical protein
MKSARVTTIAVLLGMAGTAGAVDSGKAVYVGGTLSVKEKTEAPIDLKGADELVFKPKGGPVRIPWTGIEDIEYGQKVGHRVKTAILLTPLALFSKNRRHYVTLSWKDTGGSEQAAVFEFDKNDIRPVLASLRARSGKEVAYQDDQARKQMGGAEPAK